MLQDTKPQIKKVEEIEEQQEKLNQQEISLEVIQELVTLSIKKVFTEMCLVIRIAEKENQNQMIHYATFVTIPEMMEIAKEHNYIE